MGVVFTGLFALGLLLIVQAADKVDLDAGCVLYGAIEATPLDTVDVAGLSVPRVAVVLGSMLIINLVYVLCFYKELKLTSFDPALATALGINASWMHYSLMTLVAVTAVASFESVGNILVVAMFIVPPATAYLLTDRLPVMIGLAVGLGCVSAVGGYWVARWMDGSIAAAMAVVAGVCFVVAFMFAPRHGLIARYARLFRLRRDFARSLLLSHLRLHPGGTTMATIRERFLWNQRMTANVVGSAVRDGLVALGPSDTLTLTSLGSAEAHEVPGH